MTSERIFVLSNLAAGTFIDLSVAAHQDVLEAARSQLSQTKLPLEVQHGFFVSVYPTAPPAEAGSRSSSPTPAAPAPDEPAVAAPGRSPLDAAAAKGPLDWPDAEADADAPTDPAGQQDPALADPPVVGFPLGSAGGH